MPKLLRKSEQGKKRCVTTTGVRGGKLKLCVTAGKFGFRASVRGLPVSTGNARTMKRAIKNARASWNASKMKQRKKG